MGDIMGASEMDLFDWESATVTSVVALVLLLMLFAVTSSTLELRCVITVASLLA